MRLRVYMGSEECVSYSRPWLLGDMDDDDGECKKQRAGGLLGLL